MLFTSNKTSSVVILSTILTGGSEFAIAAEECLKPPYSKQPYVLGLPSLRMEDALKDVADLWPKDKDEKIKMSHYSRALSLGLAWSDLTFIEKALHDTRDVISFCDIHQRQKDITFRIWELNEANPNLMQPKNITLTLYETDFPGGSKAARGARNIWPIIIHKMETYFQDQPSILMDENFKKIDCNKLVEGEALCAMGSLIARFTGVPMMVTPQLKPSNSGMIDDILKLANHFPVMIQTHTDFGGLYLPEQTDTQIAHWVQPNNQLAYTSPDPWNQGIYDDEHRLKDSFLLSAKKGLIESDETTVHRFILYPADYESRTRVD